MLKLCTLQHDFCHVFWQLHLVTQDTDNHTPGIDLGASLDAQITLVF